jgi:multiple sugar transport system permease protein
LNAPQVVATTGSPAAVKRPRRPPGRRSLRGSDFTWAIAFVLPYAAVFGAFVVYPWGYALWMAGEPSLYAELFADRGYLVAVVNTLIFVGLGVNLKMFLALLLSGFFLGRRWWIKPLLAAYVLPWLIAAAQACISFHWMLSGRWGLVDGVLWQLFGVEGPEWLIYRWSALGGDIVAYIWKWMPFWTVVFLAARLTIPRDIYDAAELDGASASRRFIHVTVPLLANLYFICTLLSVLWALGDFTTVYLVSSGGPADSTQVLATLGYSYAFDRFNPALAVAAAMSALPVLIPIMIVLLRRLHAAEVRL